MKVVLSIDVPDEFLREHVDELWSDPAFAGDETPKPEPHDFLRQRIEEVAGDELRVALFGWPIETHVEVHGWFEIDPERDPDGPVLGKCPHGVDLDREICEHGCRV